MLKLTLAPFDFQRQREGKASPVRHSKDDSDAIDLAPAHFPPLPTSPLALFVSIAQSGQLKILISNIISYKFCVVSLFLNEE